MKITVVGSGYVGLVTGTCLSSLGHEVVCVDVQTERVDAIRSGRAPFHEPGLDALIAEGLSSGRLSATTDLESAMSGSQVSIIAVGTPPRGTQIDLSFVSTTAQQIGTVLRGRDAYHVVVVKSTVVPGTTDTLVRQQVEESSGLEAGTFGLCMNPEFLREGSAVEDFMNPDRIVLGQWDERSGDVLMQMYASFDCPKLRTTLRNAELTKYTSNALLASLVSFSNEIATLCEAVPGTDVESIMDGLHLDRRLSPIVDQQRIVPGILSYLRAGAGFGGSCLPKDVNALRAFARERHIATPLLDAVMSVNERRPAQVVDMCQEIVGKLDGRRIAVLGLAFKPGTDDVRDSPALQIIWHLRERGATVCAYDPLVRSLDPESAGGGVVVSADAAETLYGADAAILATAWAEFATWDWAALSTNMRRPVIIDGRSALRAVALPEAILYRPIGLSADGNESEIS